MILRSHSTTSDTERPRRHGFTMVEMVVSMTILLAVSAVSMSVLKSQTRIMRNQGGRVDAEQNAVFAMSTLERELRMAGAGVVNAQPVLVAAGDSALTFNANLVSPTLGDVSAVNDDPDADPSAVSVLRKGNQFVLPGTTFTYPESTYMQAAGVESGAETISYWLAHDSTSSHSNEFILWRRANNTTAQVVARGIVHTSADTVFQYFKADTSGNVTTVSMASLPLIHAATVHGSTADTGKFAVIDSIRTVRVQFTTVYHDPRNGDVTRHVSSTIRILNAGLIKSSTCGDPPVGVTPTATASAVGATTPSITVTWPASLDEHSGQKSVQSYSLYRRLPTDSVFTDAFLTIPAGLTTYSYTDFNVNHGDSWRYGVAATDCSPASSPMGTTASVSIP